MPRTLKNPTPLHVIIFLAILSLVGWIIPAIGAPIILVGLLIALQYRSRLSPSRSGQGTDRHTVRTRPIGGRELKIINLAIIIFSITLILTIVHGALGSIAK